MTEIPNLDEVRQWSNADRASVARSLDICIERPHSPERPPRLRKVVIVVTVAAAAILLPWVLFLSFTLHDTADGGAWRLAWVGFDAALLVALAATGWLIWKRRQIAVISLTVTVTLLITDGWFDMTLSWGSSEFPTAVVTALLVELPLAIMLVVPTVMMSRRSADITNQLRGLVAGRVPLRRERVLMYPAPPPGSDAPAKVER